MPRAKALERYPNSFYMLLDRAAQGEVRIETSSESAAKNLRSELYVFRGVLRKHAATNAKYALIAEDIRFRIEGSTLIAEPRPLARSRLIAEVLKGDNHAKQDTAAEG